MSKQNNRNLLKQAIFDGIGQRYEEELSATEEFLLYSRSLDRERRRNKRVKRILLFLILAVFAFAAVVLPISCFAGSVRGTVVRVTADGCAELDIMPQKVFEEMSVGDTALVKIGSFEAEMPLTEEPISEKGKLQLLVGADGAILVCGYLEDICETYEIQVGDRVIIRKAKGVR